MRRSLLVLIISGISSGAVASGYALWNYASSDRSESTAATAIAPAGATMKSAPAGASAVASLAPSAPAMTPGVSALLAIEVARIDAGGPSVLAGRSPPNHKVTLLANGREIGSATATDEGQWSIIVSDGIAAGPLELSIVSQPKEGGAQVRGAARQLVVPPASASSLAAAALTRPQPAKTAAVDNKAPAPHVAPQPLERPQVEAKQVEAKSQRPSAPAQARAGSDDAAGKRALAEFEALVEKTRKEVAAQRAAPSASQSAPVAQNTPSNTASSTSRVVGSSEPASARASAPTAAAQSAAEQAQASAAPTSERSGAPAAMAPGTKIAAAIPPAGVGGEPAPAAISAPIPVPITFMTDETTLTANGERAAALLAEYLRLKQPAGIMLSGHADARGPDAYNMRLSRRRLEALERYLRAAGYSGELSLVPRGKREPYLGIDRRRLPLREIYQADRRVELHLTP